MNGSSRCDGCGHRADAHADLGLGYCARRGCGCEAFTGVLDPDPNNEITYEVTLAVPESYEGPIFDEGELKAGLERLAAGADIPAAIRVTRQ